VARRKTPWMKERGEALALVKAPVPSPCSFSDACGGCSYIEITYADELDIKQTLLRELFAKFDEAWGVQVEAVQSSPAEWGHRSKVTMQMRRWLDGQIFCGNSPFGQKSILEITDCCVARPEISSYFATLREEVAGMDLTKYRRACMVMRADERKLAWGGIGKGSLRQSFEDGFEFIHDGVKVGYSLQTFFQSNLAILPKLIDAMKVLLQLTERDTFYDLYGGVGLFALTVGQSCHRAIVVESNGDSIAWAQHNKKVNSRVSLRIVEGAVEDVLDEVYQSSVTDGRHCAIIDPPRSGLHESVCCYLRDQNFLDSWIYLSCNPETQARDLKIICATGQWEVELIQPWDFFPKSYHVESLVLLKSKKVFMEESAR
jgi:tRNA/tmRNA/rRNA uracil-C5-methylase (TrmA/RlmC/RlmD family)